MRKILALLFVALVVIQSCKDKDDPDPKTTGTLSGVLKDASNATAIGGATIIVYDANTNQPTGITLTTDASGKYVTELEPGSYYLKIYKQGFENIPGAGLSAVPFTIATGITQTNDYELYASSVVNAGSISGIVKSGTSALAGVLVVAFNGTEGFSSVTDKDGKYTIYNVPAETYHVKGFLADYNSDSVSATVTSGAEITNTNLSLTAGSAGSVSGKVNFLATGNIEVDVALVNPYTLETIPGLSTTTVGGSYSLSKVPNGLYLARASFKNDGKVMDPDAIIKFGQPYVSVKGGAIQKDFNVTGAVSLDKPTNDSASTAPYQITTTTPTFSWKAYSSTDDYVIEVVNPNGKVIWGGFSGSGATLTKNVSIPKSSTSVVFNSDGSATEELMPGKVYRWRVYASKSVNTGTPNWKLISVSEDQRGIITP